MYMTQFLYYFMAWPFILIGAVVDFIFWDLLSDGRWKQRQKQPDPAIYWQDQALAALRQVRELEEKSRREREEYQEREK